MYQKFTIVQCREQTATNSYQLPTSGVTYPNKAGSPIHHPMRGEIFALVLQEVLLRTLDATSFRRSKRVIHNTVVFEPSRKI
jgi:hypothetical protein